ncbi:MAG: NAD(P)/FAD-dependent oxidoreductase [Gammaproteobacteria bacterium]|nr:NAD(P)/FAD-dependent oxidoreductase [Gammaproteobacteria bacterium]
MQSYEVIIIGASASGLMCAIEAGKRGRKVLVLDHANKAGKKILMSGGGRCNFTNYDVSADNYLSHNPHFCKSALSRFTQWDFIAMVERYRIPYHEREHGQLFCNISAKDILKMLLNECKEYGVGIKLKHEIVDIDQQAEGFVIRTDQAEFASESLVIATGGLSIPRMGATPFGYKVAEQFGHRVWPTRAGLVPFTLHDKDKQRFASLSGIAINAIVSTEHKTFRENVLFTHRGLSGPAILQVSSYWQAGEDIRINLLPDISLLDNLLELKQTHPRQQLKTSIATLLPKRLVAVLLDESLANTPLQDLSKQQLESIAPAFHEQTLKPNGTEGYRTAEVTLGGVDCDGLSSKTMESTTTKGLYFIGEVVDVTGWLGGYNFQWAWSSGWCAGQVV